MSAAGSRTLVVDTFTRIEGDASLRVTLKGRRLEDVKFHVPEPPRLFEGILRGRRYQEVPDLVARICGICPVAYQMSSVAAIERALGLTVDPATKLLRRLLYAGEWIESHALHVFFLHAPDFLGYPDALAMAKEHGELVTRALRLKKIGNALVTAVGGREIHPVNAAVGGFHRPPSRAALGALEDELAWGYETALASLREVAGLPFPDFTQDYVFVSLRPESGYPMDEGRLVSNRGLDIDVSETESYFRESQSPHTTALCSRLRGQGAYLVGPLARYSLNFDRLPQALQDAARAAGLAETCTNPFKSLLVRLIETAWACQEALRIVGIYEPPPVPKRAPERPGPGTGWAVTEAPRGILYHRYSIDADGLVTEANIVPPTAQNQERIEEDLRALVPRFASLSDEKLKHRCEQAVRNYDPCISCSVHSLRVEVERV